VLALYVLFEEILTKVVHDKERVFAIFGFKSIIVLIVGTIRPQPASLTHWSPTLPQWV
jgi:hypothetical protein